MEDYYLAAEMRGRRSNMEDAHVIFFGLDAPNEPPREACMFGVFDGHGGDECARFCAQNLCKEVYNHSMFQDDPVSALEDSFVALDNQYLHLAKQLDLEDGSTASVLLLQVDANTQQMHYYLANVGDSRAVLIKRDGTAHCLVEDQTPAREDERARIKRDGGTVSFDEENNIFRVTSQRGGGLAVSRAFGDFAFKPYVTALPEVVSGVVSKDDAYILLASDGLWGDISNFEAGQAVVHRGGKRAMQYLMEEAFARGSDDNITVLLVDLQRAMPRLVDERINRPMFFPTQPSPSRANSRGGSARFSRISFSASASSPLLSTTTSVSAAHQDEIVVDPILVSVARKMSNAMQLNLNRDVDDVEIPGLPLNFSNDLVLWRDPIRTMLWFITLNAMFALAVFWNVSLVTIIALSAMLRLICAFVACRILQVLNHFKSADKWDVEQFVDANFLISERSMRYFSRTISSVVCAVRERWDFLVMQGSTTNLLITLRTLTYLYTPTPVVDLTWMMFVFVFTVPATYARNKDLVQDKVKEFSAHARTLTQPYVDRAQAKLAEMEAMKKDLFSGKWNNKKQPEENVTRETSSGRRTSSRLAGQLGENYELSEEL